MFNPWGKCFGKCCRSALALAVTLTLVAASMACADESSISHDQNEPVGAGFIGKPISLLTGAETFVRTDLALGRYYPIVLKRRYHSSAGYDSPMGYGWAHNYDRRLYTYADGAVVIRKETGWKRRFELSGGSYVTPTGEFGTLVKNVDNSFTYTLTDGSREEYDNLGRLVRLVKPSGASLVLTYQMAQREPLEGLLPTNVDQNTPVIVAYDYRLSRIAEYDLSNTPTGVYLDFFYESLTGRLNEVVDSLNRTVSYTHDNIGNLTGVSGPGLSATYEYTDAIRQHVLTLIDEGEGEYVNTYDPQGRVSSQTHGDGIIEIDYLITRQQTKVTTTIKDGTTTLNVQERTVTFDSYGQPSVVSDTFGHEIRSTRNSQGLVTREEFWENSGTVSSPVLALKSATDYTYDGQGNLLTKTEAQGSAVERLATWTYHATFGTVLTETVQSVVNPAQNAVTTHTYDANTGNRLTTTKTGLLGNGTPYSYVTTYGYNGNGQLTSIDGPRTAVTDTLTLSYGGSNLTSITRPLSGTITLADHDGLGNPGSVTDANNKTTLYTYDTTGKVLTIKAPGDAQPTTLTYISAGCSSCGASRSEIDTITLPDGTLLDFDYDATGHMSKIADGLGNSINYTYDSQGNRLSEQVRDPQNVLQKNLTFQYDALNRLARITNPDNSYAEFGYDSRGRRISLKDPKGNITTFAYDDLHQLTTSIQPGTITTSFGYDGQGHLNTVTDGNTNTTSYQYDDLGRLYRTLSPDSGTTTYTYDPAGNLTSKTDAKNVTISYQYDAENRLTKIDFPSDTDILYSYDNCLNGKGRLCTLTDQSGTSAFEYTGKGQLAKETKTTSGIPYVTQYAYDSNGNLTSTTYPSGRVVTTSYVNNRPTSVLNNGSNLATGISYKPFGNLAALTYGNGLSRSISYDNQYRISSLQTSSIQNLTYGYDFNANITAITNNLDSTKTKGYGYDALDRLNNATGPWGNIVWTYDNVGNRLTQTDGNGTATYSYQPNSNRIATISGSQSATFSFDANGNTLTENSNSFTYNQNQRLIQAAAAQTGNYTYDASGQRASKSVNGQVTLYHYDLLGRLLAETDTQGTTQAEYLYLDNQPLAKIDATGLNYIHTDHLGTPQLMTDSQGAITWQIESRPFGDNPTISGTGSLNLRFPGQYYDAESGLHQNWYRDYHSGLGRYIETDPIGLAGGINQFVYVQDDPVNWIDPVGLIRIKVGNKIYDYHGNDHHGVNPPESHVHDIETGEKVGTESGNIYDSKGKKVCGKLSKKELAALRDKLIKKLGYLGIAITAYEIYDAMTATDAQALSNLMNLLNVVPPDRREKVLQDIINKNPDKFTEIE